MVLGVVGGARAASDETIYSISGQLTRLSYVRGECWTIHVKYLNVELIDGRSPSVVAVGQDDVRASSACLT